jgi:hypothetical protein
MAPAMLSFTRDTGERRSLMPTIATGQCLCGSVRYRISGPLRAVGICHCAQCRQWHGHAGAYSNVRRTDLVLERVEDLAWYQSSPIARRGFCRNCGSSLFWDKPDRDTISVTAGTLDPPTGLTTAEQIYTGEKSDYYPLDPSIPVGDPARDVQQRRISKPI